MGETFRFLDDEDELRWFWEYVLPPLKPNEVFFLSASARSKRMSLEERSYFQLSRAEMWNRQVVAEDSYDAYLKGIRRLECNKQAFLTKSGLEYPDRVLIAYATICPVDAYAAMKAQIEHLMKIQTALTDSALKGSQGGLEQAFHDVRHSHSVGASIMARSFSSRVWADIDCDVKGWKNEAGWNALADMLIDFAELLGGRRGNVAIIETAGGLHFLVRRAALKINPQLLINTINTRFNAAGITPDETIRNTNEMVACPGTLQYGDSLVHIINKEDFSDDQRLHRL